MATTTKVNLSHEIRQIVAREQERGHDVKPSEIVEELKNEFGLDVTAQYVSTIKSNAKRKKSLTVSDDPALQRLAHAKVFRSHFESIDDADQAWRDWVAIAR